MDISTPDGVETVQQQGDTILNARNREIDGIELAREVFLFAPPTRAPLREPADILLLSTADNLLQINPVDVQSH